jgi:hypothetical protein
MASAANATASCGISIPNSSIRVCCCCRKLGFCLPTIHVSEEPFKPSGRGSCAMDYC